MNYYNIIKNTNKRLLSKQANQARKYQAEDNFSCADFLPPLSNKEKNEIDLQNDIIFNFAKEYLGITPFCISRDKAGHVLLFSTKNIEILNDTNPHFYCYMLGLDTKTNKISAYCVGKNSFKFTKGYGFIFTTERIIIPDNIHINLICTHPAFINLGIGRIMLQATENYAYDYQLSSMSLSAEKCYTSFNKRDTLENIELLAKNNELSKEEYFSANYFDKNMYFYYSNGYEEFDIENYNGLVENFYCLRPLKKDKLHKLVLDYGLAKPLVQIPTSSPIFSIKRESGIKELIAYEYKFSNRFPLYLNHLPAIDFSPIFLTPSNTSTRFLYSFLNGFPCKDISFSSVEDKRKYISFTAYNHSSPVINSNSIYSKTCEQNDFIIKLLEHSNLLTFDTDENNIYLSDINDILSSETREERLSTTIDNNEEPNA